MGGGHPGASGHRDGSARAMSRANAMTQAELDSLTDEQVAALERATQKLANEVQAQAASYQRQADRLRKALKRRKGQACAN